MSPPPLLWPPSCHDDLYVDGSSSPITRVHSPDLQRYPRQQGHAMRVSLGHFMLGGARRANQGHGGAVLWEPGTQ